MRVSSQTIRDLFIAQLGRQQTSLAQTQLQVSTGLRFNRPAQDPVAAAQSLDIQRQLDANDQYAKNANLAANRLGLVDSTLGGVGDTLQRIRELAVQAANATETPESRRLIGSEVKQRLEGLLSLANSRDANGQYLFAGYSVTTQPFSASGSGFAYNGDQGQRMVQIGEGRYVADGDPGSSIFQLVRSGNGTFATTAGAGNTGTVVAEARGVTDPSQYDGQPYVISFTSPTDYQVLDTATPTPNVIASGTYVSGQNIVFKGVQIQVSGTPVAGDTIATTPSAYRDMFTTVQGLLTALNTSAGDAVSIARFRNDVNNAIENIDQSLGNVLQVRADVGGRLQSIDSQQDTNVELGLQLKTNLSQTRDLDYAEALTRLNQQLTSLQAAQQTYVKMQGLSLFNYLR